MNEVAPRSQRTGTPHCCQQLFRHLVLPLLSEPEIDLIGAQGNFCNLSPMSACHRPPPVSHAPPRRLEA